MTSGKRRVVEVLDNLIGPLKRLDRSLTKPDTAFPLCDAAAADQAVDEIDQFLQRYQQVVDIVLRKLFPHTMSVIQGAVPPQYFRDMLDGLERADLIDDAGWWARLNDQRNRLIHEYAMEPVIRLAELNSAWAAAPVIVDQINRIRALAATL